MAKLNNYKGSIEVISGLKPKNNGDFALLQAHDVLVDEEGTRLDEKIEELSSASNVVANSNDTPTAEINNLKIDGITYEIIGEKGDTGATGPRGPQGEQGPQGVQGPAGADAPTIVDVKSYEEVVQGNRTYTGLNMLLSDGTKIPFHVFARNGEQGIQGEKGDTGEKGEQGLKGEKGDTGPQGEQGPQGERGEQGLKGEKGDTGPQGPQGEQGPMGPEGPQGESGSLNVVYLPKVLTPTALIEKKYQDIVNALGRVLILDTDYNENVPAHYYHLQAVKEITPNSSHWLYYYYTIEENGNSAAIKYEVVVNSLDKTYYYRELKQASAVKANPSEQATELLNTVDIDGQIYKIEGKQGPQGPEGPIGPEGPQGPIGPQGNAGADGTQVIANPTTEPTNELKTITIGDVDYKIASSDKIVALTTVFSSESKALSAEEAQILAPGLSDLNTIKNVSFIIEGEESETKYGFLTNIEVLGSFVNLRLTYTSTFYKLIILADLSASSITGYIISNTPPTSLDLGDADITWDEQGKKLFIKNPSGDIDIGGYGKAVNFQSETYFPYTSVFDGTVNIEGEINFNGTVNGLPKAEIDTTQEFDWSGYNRFTSRVEFADEVDFSNASVTGLPSSGETGGSVDTSKFLTTDTEQTIDSTKTIASDCSLKFQNAGAIYNESGTMTIENNDNKSIHVVAGDNHLSLETDGINIITPSTLQILSNDGTAVTVSPEQIYLMSEGDWCSVYITKEALGLWNENEESGKCTSLHMSNGVVEISGDDKMYLRPYGGLEIFDTAQEEPAAKINADEISFQTTGKMNLKSQWDLTLGSIDGDVCFDGGVSFSQANVSGLSGLIKKDTVVNRQSLFWLLEAFWKDILEIKIYGLETNPLIFGKHSVTLNENEMPTQATFSTSSTFSEGGNVIIQHRTCVLNSNNIVEYFNKLTFNSDGTFSVNENHENIITDEMWEQNGIKVEVIYFYYKDDTV